MECLLYSTCPAGGQAGLVADDRKAVMMEQSLGLYLIALGASNIDTDIISHEMTHTEAGRIERRIFTKSNFLTDLWLSCEEHVFHFCTSVRKVLPHSIYHLTYTMLIITVSHYLFHLRSTTECLEMEESLQTSERPRQTRYKPRLWQFKKNKTWPLPWRASGLARKEKHVNKPFQNTVSVLMECI